MMTDDPRPRDDSTEALESARERTEGIIRAREALAGGDESIAKYLLGASMADDPRPPDEWDWYQNVKPQLGKADWMWDDEYRLHIPCCSQPKGTWRCGNGPLVGAAILSGDCGEHDGR